MTATYFDNLDFTGPSITRIDPAIDFKWGWGSPDPAIGGDTFSARWTGQLTAPQTGQYTFHLTADDGIRLWIGGNLLIDHWKDSPGETRTATTTLQANQAYDLKLEYYENKVGAKVCLEWTAPNRGRQVIPAVYFRSAAAEHAASHISRDPATTTLVPVVQLTAPSTSTPDYTESVSLAIWPVINVRDYGAIGNGVADDTRAIREAVHALLRNQG